MGRSEGHVGRLASNLEALAVNRAVQQERGPPEGSRLTREGCDSYASARCHATLHECEALSCQGGPLRVTTDGKVSRQRVHTAPVSQARFSGLYVLYSVLYLSFVESGFNVTGFMSHSCTEAGVLTPSCRIYPYFAV